MREMVLLYNLDNEKGKKYKTLFAMQKIKIKNITKDMYLEKIGVLAGILKESDFNKEENKNISNFNDTDNIDNINIGDNKDTNSSENTIDEPMIVMSGFSDAKLNEFLYMVKKRGLERIELKAIITSSNCMWNSYRLYNELKKEHILMNLK